jgi:hypothetical protein
MNNTIKVSQDVMDELVELHGSMEYRSRFEPALIKYVYRLEELLNHIYPDRVSDQPTIWNP